MLQKVECFTAGNIHNHLSQGKSITSEPFIIDIVISGLKLRFAEKPAQSICPNLPITNTEKKIISNEIQKLSEKEVIYPCMRGKGYSLCHLYLTESKRMALTE